MPDLDRDAYALLLAEDWRLNPARLAALAAPILSLPRGDLTGRLRKARGLLWEHLDAATALRLTRTCADAGLPLRRVRQEEVPSLLPSRSVRGVKFTAFGLRCQIGSERDARILRFADFELATVAILPTPGQMGLFAEPDAAQLAHDPARLAAWKKARAGEGLTLPSRDLAFEPLTTTSAAFAEVEQQRPPGFRPRFALCAEFVLRSDRTVLRVTQGRFGIFRSHRAPACPAAGQRRPRREVLRGDASRDALPERFATEFQRDIEKTRDASPERCSAEFRRDIENTQSAEESFLELVDRAGLGGVPQSPAWSDFTARRFSDRLVFEDDAELRAFLRWALARQTSGDGKPDHE